MSENIGSIALGTKRKYDEERKRQMIAEELDRLIDEIVTDAHGDDEQLWAFHCALEEGIELPCDAFVIGEAVAVVAFD